MNTTDSKNALFRGTSIVAAFTLLSRVLGFIRDLLFARLFGSSYIADAFFVAFRIPNLLRSFVAEGALTSAFVPVFTRELENSKNSARDALRSTTGLLLLLTLSLSIVGCIFAPELVSIFAPGFEANAQQVELCTTLLRVMIFYIVFVSFVAMLNGALNSVKIFGIAAFAQVVMNMTLIFGVWVASYFVEPETAIVLSYFVIIGGLLQVLVQIPAMKRAELFAFPSTKLITRATREIIKLMIPAILGAAVYQLGMYVNTVLASLLQEGSVSWLFYADRIAQLPVGVFTVALSSVLLPTLSTAAARKDEEGFSSSLLLSLRYTSFLLIPLSVGLYYYAQPIIQLMFERGAFTSRSTLMTAQALQSASFGLWAFSCHALIIRSFLGRKDTVTPTIIGAITLLLTISMSLIFMGEVQRGSETAIAQAVTQFQYLLTGIFGSFDLKHSGLALASALGAYASFFMAALVLSMQASSIKWASFFSSSLRSLFSAALMLGSFLLLDQLLLSPLSTLLLAVPAGAFIYFATAILMKSEEAFEIKNLLMKRLR